MALLPTFLQTILLTTIIQHVDSEGKTAMGTQVELFNSTKISGIGKYQPFHLVKFRPKNVQLHRRKRYRNDEYSTNQANSGLVGSCEVRERVKLKSREFLRYDVRVRPILDHRKSLKVHIKISLYQIIEVVSKNREFGDLKKSLQLKVVALF